MNKSLRDMTDEELYNLAEHKRREWVREGTRQGHLSEKGRKLESEIDNIYSELDRREYEETHS